MFLFFTWNLLPESPRWLVSKGKTREATQILKKIAETNNVAPPADLAARVEKLSASNKEESLGYLSLFGSCILCLRTILMTIGFTASAFVYYQVRWIAYLRELATYNSFIHIVHYDSILLMTIDVLNKVPCHVGPILWNVEIQVQCTLIKYS